MYSTMTLTGEELNFSIRKVTPKIGNQFYSISIDSPGNNHTILLDPKDIEALRIAIENEDK